MFSVDLPDIDISLPSFFPTEEISVGREKHTYKVYEGDTQKLTKDKYILDKSPVNSITKVEGTVDNSSTVFEQGVDYKLSSNSQNREKTFTYTDEQEKYKLSVTADSGSISVSNDEGNSYTEDTDYEVYVQSGVSVIEWLNNDKPDLHDEFFINYKYTYEDSSIEWLSNERPDDNTDFFVTYKADPILSRFTDSAEEEFSVIEDDIENAINSKFIDHAHGEELDELGKLFGPVIGKRSGRDDTQYRIYLKSVVDSFISRGTKSGIKIAISAATDVPVEDITIDENFQNNEYEVIVIPDTPVKTSVLQEVAEIADPSGVKQLQTRFRLDPEDILTDDSINIKKQGDSETSETTNVDDTVSTSETNVLVWESSQWGEQWANNK